MQQRRAGSPFSERVSVTGPLQRADSLWSLREALNLLKIALLCHAQSHQDPVKPRHIDRPHGHSLWLRCWPLAHSNNITVVVYPAIPTSQLRSSSLIVSRRISGLRKLRVCGPYFLCKHKRATRKPRPSGGASSATRPLRGRHSKQQCLAPYWQAIKHPIEKCIWSVGSLQRTSLLAQRGWVTSFKAVAVPVPYHSKLFATVPSLHADH